MIASSSASHRAAVGATSTMSFVYLRKQEFFCETILCDPVFRLRRLLHVRARRYAGCRSARSEEAHEQELHRDVASVRREMERASASRRLSSTGFQGSSGVGR